MQFTRATEYAALGILHLAMLEEGAVVSTEEIAQQRSVPAKFLAGVTRDLVRAGIISAHRGRNGGVSLARRPAAITLRDVYEAVEGKMQVAECLRPNPNCSALGDCVLQGVWEELQVTLLDAMGRVTFSDLADRERVLRAPSSTAR